MPDNNETVDNAESQTEQETLPGLEPETLPVAEPENHEPPFPSEDDVLTFASVVQKLMAENRILVIKRDGIEQIMSNERHGLTDALKNLICRIERVELAGGIAIDVYRSRKG